MAALVAAGGVALGHDALVQAADATRGRVEGDMTLVAALGAVAAPRGARGEAELRLRYLESAGVLLSYEDGVVFGGGAEPRRVLCGGLELRPLFLFRWLRGYAVGPARVDLLIDSVGLELGGIFVQPAGGAFASRSGLEVALSAEVPLFERATGPWIGLRGGLRWSQDALASGVVHDADDRSAFLVMTLGWHQVVATHLVDLGDEAPR